MFRSTTIARGQVAHNRPTMIPAQCPECRSLKVAPAPTRRAWQWVCLVCGVTDTELAGVA